MIGPEEPAAPHRGYAPGLVILGLAITIRALVDRRNPPGVTQDSVVYIDLAPHAPFAPFSPTRPSGYPFVLRLLDVLPGDHLDVVTAVQHAAGIAVGVMVFLLVTWTGVRRGLALAAAALTVVDAHTVALEQAILAESLFTLTVVGSVFLVVNGRARAPVVAASGLLLGLACTMRTAGLFVVPVWLAWLAFTKFGRRAVLVGLAAVAAPVLAYCGIHASESAGFSLVSSEGWYLYAKVAPIADCAGAAVPRETLPLCAGARDRPFEYYLYDPGSPAYRLFDVQPGVDLEKAVTAENNRLLRRFSLAVIRAHPVDFAEAIGKEFFRYLGPAEAQNEMKFYAEPGTPLDWYERWVHMPWWLVTGAFLAFSTIVWFGDRCREMALLMGMAGTLILSAAATSGFNSRYLVPTVPLVAPVLAVAFTELLDWRRPPASDPAPATSPPA